MRQGSVEVQGVAVSFGEKLARSEAFKGLFREGMALVEATASYLDGPGRDDAKRLPRGPALAYAAESMRLTTRLMQLASWLLLQRAVNEGELTQAEAAARLRELIDTSLRLQTQIIRFDQLINNPDRPVEPTPQFVVRDQLNQLRAAFEA
jgi:regulator of CtrA degradation